MYQFKDNNMTSLQDYLSQKSTNTAVNEVILTIAEVGKTINHLLQRGAFANILGEAGNQNVQGEEQKKLDVIANNLLLDALTQSQHCAGVASEELDDATSANTDGSLLVLFDPLDGSSNIDINMAVGTIFSILPYQRQGQAATNADFLQKGDAQLAAGYLLYGPATMLAVSTGDGVAMFGYDPQQEAYLLIKDGVRIDEDTKEYAINGSNYRHWQAPMQQYVDEVIAGKTGTRGKDFNTRWVAAMVGDVHRILCRGGVFMYPFDNKDPSKAGKLRLMYEANPMSLLIEQAGGRSTTATQRIMDIEPSDIHQRVPVVLGSKNEVEYIQKLHENVSNA